MDAGEIHRVYTEQMSPVLTEDGRTIILCEDTNDLLDENYYDEIILTTNDKDVTCQGCLQKLEQGGSGHDNKSKV